MYFKFVKTKSEVLGQYLDGFYVIEKTDLQLRNLGYKVESVPMIPEKTEGNYPLKSSYLKRSSSIRWLSLLLPNQKSIILDIVMQVA